MLDQQDKNNLEYAVEWLNVNLFKVFSITIPVNTKITCSYSRVGFYCILHYMCDQQDKNNVEFAVEWLNVNLFKVFSITIPVNTKITCSYSRVFTVFCIICLTSTTKTMLNLRLNGYKCKSFQSVSL